MRNYIIELLKKTKFRRPVGSDFKYFHSSSPWNTYRAIDALASTSFNNQNLPSNIPGENPTANVPVVSVDYMVLENEDFLMAENNDNIII